MVITAPAIVDTLLASFASARRTEKPYRNWYMTRCLPDDCLDAVLDLPFPAPALGGVSGKREIHNATRRYFDQENMGRHPICKAFNEAFQDARVTGRIASTFGTQLAGTYLRVEFAQDTDGFWLEPHTDIGAKLFTMLIYLSEGPGAADWGTDIYDGPTAWVGRAPADFNRGLIFVPGADTWHGFRPRDIRGVRRSLIVNYVVPEWRARHELAYPVTAVA